MSSGQEALPQVPPPQPGSGRLFRRINPVIISKFCKYLFLLVSMVLTLIVVFDAYSFYLARRDIDAELKSKKVPSLEFLNLTLQRERALAVTTLEGRCTERLQLTMFRILNAEHDQIQKAYNELLAIKSDLTSVVEKLGQGLIDTSKAKEFLAGIRFDLTQLDDHLAPLNDEAKSHPRYTTLLGEITKHRERYANAARQHEPLRAKIEATIKEKGFDKSIYWNMTAIRNLATRIDQLRDERKKSREKYGDVEDIIARYAVWIGALTGGVADHSFSDDIAYHMGRADAAQLKDQDCTVFDEYYKLATGRSRANSTGVLATFNRYYRHYLSLYFQQPPGAQTLFVTLILGALGALTLNVLRLSSVGWWAHQAEPLWGEIIVGPLLGALAAFGIFLLGSAGLLLAADTNGGQPLSAYFIGLLGFLSGLMYDEAFGRVRRLGTQMFAAAPNDDAANARAEDRSLAEALRTNGASLAAALVLKYGIGTRVSLESEFTLLIPSDEAVGRLPLSKWNDLNSKVDAFERWYHQHHAAKRVARSDVPDQGQGGATADLIADDSRAYKLSRTGDDLMVDDIRVLIADVIWNKGVVHILSEDLR